MKMLKGKILKGFLWGTTGLGVSTLLSMGTFGFVNSLFLQEKINNLEEENKDLREKNGKLEGDMKVLKDEAIEDRTGLWKVEYNFNSFKKCNQGYWSDNLSADGGYNKEREANLKALGCSIGIG